MHVVQISFHVDTQRRRGAELLRTWPTLVHIAESARSAGHQVTMVHAASESEVVTRDGIDYHFVSADGWGRPLAGSESFRSLLSRLRPDVIHVHGFGFSAEVLALRRLVGSTPILLQDHCDRPPRFWRRPRWRRSLAAADGLGFCAREQAGKYAGAMQLPAKTVIVEVPENSCRFVPGDQAAARAATGLHGDPCVLMVGNLLPRKDPLTVLEGVRLAARELPGVQLWYCFATDELRGAIERRVAQDPALRSRVHLLGPVPHARVETLMQAADLFVLGSHSEGSGFAVIEALACGLPCVVTDIPSFRGLVGEGDLAAGALWKCGDAAGLAQALVRCAAQPPGQRRAAARRRFDDESSFVAVGRKLDAAYRAVGAAAAGPAAGS